MNEEKEDLSGPYESWATARLDMPRRNSRLRPAGLALLWVTLAVAALNTWVLIANVLHPLWNKPPDHVLCYALAVPAAGVLLLFVSTTLKWRHKGVAALGLCSLGTLMALTFAPLTLYVNQRGDPHDLACALYKVSKKRIVRGKGLAYDVTFLSATGAENSLRISRRQFDLLSEGATVQLHIGSGLMGVSYVEKIVGGEVRSCGET